MSLTVKDILHLTIMKDAIIRCGKKTLTQQKVEWISVIETPVENFVRKNEFVLTTGIGCGMDEKKLLQFIKDIIQAKAAALVISVGRFITSTPQSVIDFANQNQFTIIEIPWEVRFSDIIHSTLGVLHGNEYQVFQESEDIQKRLLSLLLKGTTLNELANFVYKTLKLPTVITDKRGRICGKSHLSNQLNQDWIDYIEGNQKGSRMTENEYFPSIVPTEWIELQHSTGLKMGIYSASELQGFLLVAVKNNSCHPNLIAILEHVATAVALNFLHEQAIRETESRLRDDFVWSLAKGKLSSWDTALSRAKSLNFHINLPYVCLIGYPENLNEIYLKVNHSVSSFEHWLGRNIRLIEEEVYDTGLKMNRKVMATFQGNELVIFLEVVEEKMIKDIQLFLNHFEKRMSILLKGSIFSWGISKQYGFRKFHDSFREAERALKIGKRQKGPGHRSAYADTRIDRVLYGLLENEELKQITDSTIGSLIDYSTERGIDLLHTFVTYNQNRGNVSQTARELNLHRQSLLYRLRKIETLTGCSLDDPNDVFLIDLSVRLWTYGINNDEQN